MPPHGPVSSTDVFKPDILKGQVVFATGAGTGINRGAPGRAKAIADRGRRRPDLHEPCAGALALG